MKRSFAIGVAAALFAVPAWAQPERGGPPGGGPGGPGMMGRGPGASLLGLVGMEAVRAELKLTDEQKATVDEIIAAERGGERPDFSGTQEMTEDERRAHFEKLRREHEEKVHGLLAKVLKTEQMERLLQIQLQSLGVAGLNRPDVAARLELSSEQKEKVAALLQERSTKLRDAMRSLFQEGGGDFSAMREKLDELRRQEDEKVLAVLTDPQRAALEKLKGEPFDMPRFGRGPGPRGPAGDGDDDGR
ncbi:MAG: hypothetical protein C4547_00785 [Phycisphaerales bacterium]|nr:MAG: hypothetical protein C4547_00785 [Phycisphaerales bacterium]